MGLRKEKNSARIGQALQDGLQAFSVYIPLIAIVIIATSIRSRWTAARKHSQAAYGAHTRPAWQTACSRRPGSVNFRVIYLLLHACLGAAAGSVLPICITTVSAHVKRARLHVNVRQFRIERRAKRDSMICSFSTFTPLCTTLPAARAVPVCAPSLWPSPSYLAKIQFLLQTGSEAELKLGIVILIGNAAEGCARRNILDTDFSPHLQRQ